jgi:pyrimidine operon attenuation protein/uracil phosphoribosyltransferase
MIRRGNMSNIDNNKVQQRATIATSVLLQAYHGADSLCSGCSRRGVHIARDVGDRICELHGQKLSVVRHRDVTSSGTDGTAKVEALGSLLSGCWSELQTSIIN